MTREEIGNKLFDLANALSGDETGHLGAIIHCVVSELNHGADAFSMIHNVEYNMMLIRALRGHKQTGKSGETI